LRRISTATLSADLRTHDMLTLTAWTPSREEGSSPGAHEIKRAVGCLLNAVWCAAVDQDLRASCRVGSGRFESKSRVGTKENRSSQDGFRDLLHLRGHFLERSRSQMSNTRVWSGWWWTSVPRDLIARWWPGKPPTWRGRIRPRGSPESHRLTSRWRSNC